jgi:hypothetical protein
LKQILLSFPRKQESIIATAEIQFEVSATSSSAAAPDVAGQYRLDR